MELINDWVQARGGESLTHWCPLQTEHGYLTLCGSYEEIWNETDTHPIYCPSCTSILHKAYKHLVTTQ